MHTRWSDIDITHIGSPSTIILGVILGLLILGIAFFIIMVYIKSKRGHDKVNGVLKKYNTSIEQLKSAIKDFFKK